jgi:hypothetical protein
MRVSFRQLRTSHRIILGGLMPRADLRGTKPALRTDASAAPFMKGKRRFVTAITLR